MWRSLFLVTASFLSLVLAQDVSQPQRDAASIPHIRGLQASTVDVIYKYDFEALSTTESGEALQKIQAATQAALKNLTSGTNSPLIIDSVNIRATGT
jgi:hypothetical protein